MMRPRRASGPRRGNWRKRYAEIEAMIDHAVKLSGSSRWAALAGSFHFLRDVESSHPLPTASARFKAECALELKHSRALPGRWQGRCSCCAVDDYEDRLVRHALSRRRAPNGAMSCPLCGTNCRSEVALRACIQQDERDMAGVNAALSEIGDEAGRGRRAHSKTDVALRQRRALGLGPDDPFEYSLWRRRPLTPDERTFAEDQQVLESVALFGVSTVGTLARSFLQSESATRKVRGHEETYVLDWGRELNARRTRIEQALRRLLAAKLVRLVRRRWIVTRSGYERAGMVRWAHERREIARALARSR